MQVPETIYKPTFDLNYLTYEQRRKFSQHQITSTFSPALAIFLHFITIGIFTLIFFGLKHSQLPMIKHDDFKAGKAIGFMFIPFFNFYWVFKFWLRLVDRINFQLRLRREQRLISKGLMLTTIIILLIPYVNLASLVMFPICIYQIQTASNKLASQIIKPRLQLPLPPLPPVPKA